MIEIEIVEISILQYFTLIYATHVLFSGLKILTQFVD